jgi:predicted acetyltransferase
MIRLVWPSTEYLASYQACLEQGWSPNNLRPQARFDELESIAQDSERFLRGLVDIEAAYGPVTLPNGEVVPKLPGYRRWLVDDISHAFVGSMGFRWLADSNELPPYCLGHIGYSIVAAYRGLGYATEGLRQLLMEAPERGLRYVYITCSPDNIASQRVIEKNGGQLLYKFVSEPGYGSHEELKYRIDLNP